MKFQKVKTIHQILELISGRDWSGEINHAFARNLLEIAPLIQEFKEKNKIRIETLCKRDAKGRKLVKDNQWDFGDNQELADTEYQKLLDTEVEFTPYQIQRSPETDKLPGAVQAELLNVIILLEPSKAK